MEGQGPLMSKETEAHGQPPAYYPAQPGQQPYPPAQYGGQPGQQPYPPAQYGGQPGQPYPPVVHYGGQPGGQPYTPPGQVAYGVPAGQPGPQPAVIIVPQQQPGIVHPEQMPPPGLRLKRLFGCGVALAVLGIVVFILSLFSGRQMVVFGILLSGLYVATGACAIAAAKRTGYSKCLLVAIIVLGCISASLSGIGMIVDFAWGIPTFHEYSSVVWMFVFAGFFNLAVMVLSIILASTPCNCCYLPGYKA